MGHRRLLRGGQLTKMAGTEWMEWHQTPGNHVFDVFYTISTTDSAPVITTSWFYPIKVPPTSCGMGEDLILDSSKHFYSEALCEYGSRYVSFVLRSSRDCYSPQSWCLFLFHRGSGCFCSITSFHSLSFSNKQDRRWGVMEGPESTWRLNGWDLK